MTGERSRHAPLREGAHDPPQVSRALGVLFLCGALLVIVQVSLPDREHAHVAGLYGIGGLGLVLGSASVIWAKYAREWTVHTLFATGTALICLGVYSSGVATGAYSVLFVWLVVMAASFFSPKAILAHVVWILVASRVTLGVVETSGVSATIRWTFGSLLLVVAAVMMSRIVSERRSIEDQLRTEIEEKARLQREFEHLAHHDPLTGLPNRRRFEQELARELARATRHNAQLSVVSLDLDQFKEYNDAHGHVAGDRLLKLMASAWTERLRAADVIARIGGDEFVVVLPDCPPDDAERVVQRLCRPIPLGLTCSAGTACWDGRESAQELYARADRAMYEAKECTTVCAAGETASGVGN
jgi:diguanylate cyclase (GGDEF)-like protein